MSDGQGDDPTRDLLPERFVLDGVPVFSLPLPGPLRATLMFRVGLADETLPTRGITHLVEHLALFPLMETPDPSRLNGWVEPLRTGFTVTGTTSEVKAFLENVTSNLADLPMERLEAERRVLRTEAANSFRGSLKELWSNRFGAEDYGLTDYPEYGLRRLEASDIHGWATQRFNAGNAALWLSGPIPDDLKLKLSPGARYPSPAVTPPNYATPAIYCDGDRWVGLSILATNNRKALVATLILNARVRRRLRHEEAIAYEAHASYYAIDDDAAEILVFADSLTNQAHRAAELIVSITRELAVEDLRLDELEAIVTEILRRDEEDPQARFLILDRAIRAELSGRKPMTDSQMYAAIKAVTPSDVADVIGTAMSTALLAVPEGVPCDFDGFVPIPASTGGAFEGNRVFPMGGSGHSSVIDYSDAGISITEADHVTAMRWQDVVGILWWIDGRHTLIGAEATYINVVPGEWKYPESVVEALTANVPSERWVPMDEPGASRPDLGPVCQLCGGTPAISVTLRYPWSFFIIWMRRTKVVVCRDCGIAEFRLLQKRTLLAGWWSLPGLVVTPVSLYRNMVENARLRRLPEPFRPAGKHPLRKGRSVLLHPGMLVPVGLIGAVVALIELYRTSG